MKAFLHRWRWAVFGVTAVVLIAAAYLSYGATTSKVAGVLGPTPGPNSSGHIAAQRAYLARVSKSHPSTASGALISLARMMRATDAEALRPGGKLTAIFVRFPTSQPEALKLTGSISDAMNERAKQLQGVVQAEISGLRKELGTAKGAQRAQTQSMIAQRQSGLAQITGDCACIYALVVERSTLGKLEAEQETAGVRLVDVPDPPVATLQGWQLTPIIPGARTG